MKNVVLTICLMLVLLTGGCGTLMHGSTQEVAVTSNPPGAIVTNTDYTCWIKTPGVMVLDRANSTVLTARLFGHEDAKAKVKVSLSPWLLGNAAGWDMMLNVGYVPVVPVTVVLLVGDMATGSVGQLSPNTVHFELVSREKKGE